MRQLKLYQWAAVLMLAIAVAPRMTSAQEDDTLSISGTFVTEFLWGTVGDDLLEVGANDYLTLHTWTLTLHDASYSHVLSFDPNLGEQYVTRVHATSFDFEFIGPDADILNSVFSPELTGGGLDDGAFFEAGQYIDPYFYTTIQVNLITSSGAEFTVYGESDWDGVDQYFPLNENGYPVVTPNHFEYLLGEIYDHRPGNWGGIYSYQSVLDIGEPPVLPPPPAPLPTLSIADASVWEGNRGTTWLDLTVTLSREPDNVVTVDYETVDGSAKQKSDYTATSGTLTFQPGQSEATISIAIKADRKREPHEIFYVELFNADGATISDGVATATIMNDD